MNKTIYALESLASDLKRVSTGLQRESFTMANRFSEEALKRKEEVDVQTLKPYIKKILSNLETTLTQKDPSRKAEDTLMYSVLIQNYCQKYGSE